MTEQTQLQQLATRVPSKLIGKNHGGKDAMDHTVVTQYLLGILGPYNTELIEVVRSGTKKDPDAHVVTGIILKLSGTIDGQEFSITEAGGLENAGNPDGDGERLKHCFSDAIKRCAMRLGLGLHIWSGKMYFLDKALEARNVEAAKEAEIDLGVADDLAEAREVGGAPVVAEYPESGVVVTKKELPPPTEDQQPPEPDLRDKVQEATEAKKGKGKSEKKKQDEPAPGEATKQIIRELAEELFAGGVAEVEEKKGKKIDDLTPEQAMKWVKGLQKLQEKREAEVEKMKGAAVAGNG